MAEPVKIFITGGTGFIGKHFLERLSQWPAEAVFYVLVRKDIPLDDPRFVKLKGDLREIEAQADILRSCDYIFHLAANVNFFGGTSDDDKINFESTKKIVDLLTSHNNRLKNLIFISTIGAVDRHQNDTFAAPLNLGSTPAPTTIYGKSKLKSEAYIKYSGLPFTIIRPTWVYGKNMREKSHLNSFVSLVFARSPICFFNFPGRVSLIYVGDLVSSFIGCINNPATISKTYFATTEADSIGGLFRVIYKEIFGRLPKQLPIPGFLKNIIRSIHSRIPLTVANLFLDYLYADGGDYVKDFGITHPVSFSQGLKEVINSNASLAKRVYAYTTSNGLGRAGTMLKQSLYPLSFFKQVLPERGTILDFGCGEGMLTNAIAQALDGVHIRGYDKDAAKIEQAKKAARPNAAFFNEAIETVTANNIQAVIFNDILHHHERTKQKALIEKALSCLAPDGVLVLKEVDRTDVADRWWTTFWDRRLYPKDRLNMRTAAEWKNLLHDLGWKEIQRHTVKHFWPASRTIFVFARQPASPHA